ncbi:hypothetical protein FKP32DRAFT_1670978 [Trametes sanguinea]|nr:hypothetical protein FKP32DRAFT_1670978 [Trametes sanguinea]
MNMNPGEYIVFRDERTARITRDLTHWWPQGGGVLVARNYQAFRFPLPTVLPYSSVLQHKFSNADAAYLDDNGLTCMAVYLDEEPKAIQVLLQYLLEGSYQFARGCHESEEAYWRIHVGIKYGVQGLVDAMQPVVLRYLHDEQEEYAKNAKRLRLPFDNPSIPIVLLNIAQLLQDQQPRLLPSALIYCSLLSPRDILRPVKLSTGSTLSIPQPWVERCLSMQSSLLRVAIRIVTETFKSEASPACVHPSGQRHCAATMSALRTQALQKLASPILPMMQPFRAWTQLIASGDCGLCASCMARVLERERGALEGRWRELPCTLDVELAQGWPVDGSAENCCRRHCIQPSNQEPCLMMLSRGGSHENNWDLYVNLDARKAEGSGSDSGFESA